MSSWEDLDSHIHQVRGCRICPRVEPPPVIARPEVWPRMILVGQAPGPRERDIGKPFAFTAGTRLFAWFASLGAPEEEFRRRVLMAAVIRCFPGRAPQGGDRPPAPDEIANCSPWLEEEIQLLRPLTIIAVGQHAIAKFVPQPGQLSERVGQVFPGSRGDVELEVVPLPHPSGRSTWLVRPENQARLERALKLLSQTRGWQETFG